MDKKQHEQWTSALKSSKASSKGGCVYQAKSAKGIGPNKAAGRKGGIRRQGSKRG